MKLLNGDRHDSLYSIFATILQWHSYLGWTLWINLHLKNGPSKWLRERGVGRLFNHLSLSASKSGSNMYRASLKNINAWGKCNKRCLCDNQWFQVNPRSRNLILRLDLYDHSFIQDHCWTTIWLSQSQINSEASRFCFEIELVKC